MDHTFDYKVGSAAQYQALGFNAYSVRIDNNTNQWLFEQAIGVYISPYTIGAVYPLGGLSTASFSFTTKPGTAQAAVIAGEVATVTYFDYEQPASAGQTTVVRAPSTEWRNPKALAFQGSVVVAGPTGSVTDWSYTVPAGRRARIDSMQVTAELVASDGSGSATEVSANVVFFPLGASGLPFLSAIIYNGTVQGSRADAALPASKELQATDIVAGIHKNLRGAGVTALMFEQAVITEGDA